jgi:hypothetical protein
MSGKRDISPLNGYPPPPTPTRFSEWLPLLPPGPRTVTFDGIRNKIYNTEFKGPEFTIDPCLGSIPRLL